MSEITKVVVFMVGGAEYALPIECVQSIENPGDITSAQAPDYVAGMCVVRGEILPLVYTQRLLDPSKEIIDGQLKWIILSMEQRQVGLIVDEAKEILDLSGIAVKQLGMLGLANQNYFLGVANVNSRLITIMDPQKLFMLNGVENLQENMYSHP